MLLYGSAIKCLVFRRFVEAGGHTPVSSVRPGISVTLYRSYRYLMAATSSLAIPQDLKIVISSWLRLPASPQTIWLRSPLRWSSVIAPSCRGMRKSPGSWSRASLQSPKKEAAATRSVLSSRKQGVKGRTVVEQAEGLLHGLDAGVHGQRLLHQFPGEKQHGNTSLYRNKSNRLTIVIIA